MIEVYKGDRCKYFEDSKLVGSWCDHKICWLSPCRHNWSSETVEKFNGHRNDSKNIESLQAWCQLQVIHDWFNKAVFILCLCNSTQLMVAKKCYKLLEVYLKGKSGWVMILPIGDCCLHTLHVYVCYRKNEFYVARFIPVFTKHIGRVHNVVNMLIELLRDNL